MPDDSFFDQLRDWSQWKHRLLDRYLKGFAGILGSRHKTLFYVDGFAGGGTYGDGEPGSPVIAAKLAAELGAKGRYQLRCINIEPKMFEQLCAATAEFGADLVVNRKGTLAANLSYVMKAVGEDPALFFLDPFGHVGMEWEVVRRIVRRAATAPTDVLLRFSPSSVDRHGMGWLNSELADAASHVATADALFGSQDWRHIAENYRDSKEARWGAYVNLYQERLAREFASAKSRCNRCGGALCG